MCMVGEWDECVEVSRVSGRFCLLALNRECTETDVVGTFESNKNKENHLWEYVIAKCFQVEFRNE